MTTPVLVGDEFIMNSAAGLRIVVQVPPDRLGVAAQAIPCSSTTLRAAGHSKWPANGHLVTGAVPQLSHPLSHVLSRAFRCNLSCAMSTTLPVHAIPYTRSWNHKRPPCKVVTGSFRFWPGLFSVAVHHRRSKSNMVPTPAKLNLCIFS